MSVTFIIHDLENFSSKNGIELSEGQEDLIRRAKEIEEVVHIINELAGEFDGIEQTRIQSLFKRLATGLDDVFWEPLKVERDKLYNEYLG